MKKLLVVGVIGLTAIASTSFSQGTIAFNTYGANGGSGFYTTYGAGTFRPGANFDGNATLLFSTSPINEAATTILTVTDPLTPGWSVATVNNAGVTPISGGFSYGMILGPNFHIPTYSGSALVYFQIIAYNGASYGSSNIRGHSASWSTALATGTRQPPWTESGNWQVFTVPEPSTLALAGLGLASMLIACRRK